MPVLLDNIQFYHGPSKAAKRPSFAFNSNQKGSEGFNTLLSGEQAAFSDEPAYLATDASTIVPTGFVPPAANAENTTHQHAVGSPNLFDIELARSWGAAMPLLGTLEASDRDACPYTSDEKMPGDSPSSFGANSGKSAELDCSDVFPRSQPSSASPLQPPQPPSIAVLSPESEISYPETLQSHMVEDVQWRRNQPSYNVDFESLSPAHAWDMSDMSTEFGEHSSNTAPSSISSCSAIASKKRSETSPYIPSLENCPDDCSDDHEEVSQTRLISGCFPEIVPESDNSGPVDPLHFNMPDSMDHEQANSRESVNSPMTTPSVEGDKNPVFTNPRKCKKKNAHCLGPENNTLLATSAPLIPPPRPRPVRSVRLRPKPALLNAYGSESSEDCDDSSDEDFVSGAMQSELSDVHPSRTAPYYPSDTSFGSSTQHYESRDIVGRAILTIETQGSEPTFFFTLVPDNVPSISYVAAHSPPHNSEKAGGVLKPSMSVNRSTRATRGKSKRRTYSTDENNLLVKLREERKLTWKEITDYFPGRASSALQVHYSTKLKPRRAKRSRPQSRRGRKK
ncbi:uncharacterized protein N7458_002608 [Penicillium daleae]|uniref:Myb-like domain-containing protein n=1 Tax=Penicillium daleae TaxID=63821 RepID=A0AAD6CD21_9EURO|nr:uncharacterized protein N7458_002608 [Penicillium daleae]KAJ5461056.1 hypothetical protein N7458_002608 [Penicillium daleae]